jgi:hypothetical protein
VEKNYLGVGQAQSASVLQAQPAKRKSARSIDELEFRHCALQGRNDFLAGGQRNGKRVEGRDNVPVRNVEPQGSRHEHHTHEILGLLQRNGQPARRSQSF